MDSADTETTALAVPDKPLDLMTWADLQAKYKVPVHLRGARADEWVTNKIIELGPIAIAIVEAQLRDGNKKERMEAARLILDASGHGKTDKPVGNVAPVLILTGNAVIQPPWEQPLPAKPTKLVGRGDVVEDES